MRTLTRVLIAVVAVAVVASVLPQAYAVCGAAGVLSTNSGGVRSWSWNPGMPGWNAPNYYTGYAPYTFTGPPLSAGAEGLFWRLGTGNTALGAGDDSGTWFASAAPIGAYGNGGPGWWYHYSAGGYYYAAELLTGWGANPGIDGCITSGGSCTCILLTDEVGGVGYFALLANTAAANLDTSFTQPGNDGAGNFGPIIMAPLPSAAIGGSGPAGASSDVNIGAGDKNITASVSTLPVSGRYEQGGCNCGSGFRLYATAVPNGGSVPSSRQKSNWTLLNQAGGAPQPATGTPFGGSVTVEALCDHDGDNVTDADVDLYLAAEVVLDSGFSTLVVSQNSTRVSCGTAPTLADPTDRPRIKPNAPLTPRRRR